MSKSVCLFVDEKGSVPVEEFVLSLPVKERAKIFAYLSELEAEGPKLRRPMADYLGNGIYELRPKDNRVFYFFYLREYVVLLHAIRKKTDKIPQVDLTICQKRKRQVEAGEALIQKIDR